MQKIGWSLVLSAVKAMHKTKAAPLHGRFSKDKTLISVSYTTQKVSFQYEWRFLCEKK